MFKTGSPVLQEVVDELTRKATRNALREATRVVTEKSVIQVLVARFWGRGQGIEGRVEGD
jgi:hypothetical protein